MRIVYYFMFVIMIGVAIEAGNGALASAKTVEAGDSNSGWSGNGEVMDLENGEQVINGIMKGVMIARHKVEATMVIHSSRLVCSVRVNQDRKNVSGVMAGLCTIVAHTGKDVAYGQWKCVRVANVCEGEFTFTGGTGGFSGISGTTPFNTMIVFELLEGKHGQASGYAQWPNLTYTLP